MALLQLVRVAVGDVGVLPGEVKMLSTDNLNTITTAGYLNLVSNQLLSVSLAPTDVISCIYSYNQSTGSGLYVTLTVSITAGVVTLTPSNNLNALTSGHLFVGNASNVATDVALSGDATLANTGAMTIANNAITTAKINAAAVTLAKLDAGITPSHIIKFGGQLTTVGGAAAEAFTVTGAVAATDFAFVQIVDNGTNNVTALQAVVTNNTLTITFSGDPGAGAIVNFQLIRAAS